VQTDFVDTYYNNTLKTMSGYRWAARFCNRSRFAMFVDDDYYVYTHNVIGYLRNLSPQQASHLYAGYIPYGQPGRDPKSKWYVSLPDYPFDKYPPFISAGAYLVSMEVLIDFHIAMMYTRRYIFDDVFVSIVAKKLGVKPVPLNKLAGSGKSDNDLAIHGHGPVTTRDMHMVLYGVLLMIIMLVIAAIIIYYIF
jgi:hypothetical protein